MSPCTVRVIEECRIAAPPHSVPTTSIPLTFFDLMWFPLCFVHRIFIYESHHSIAHFTNTIIPNLKHSLSLTLEHFFPLAGNLTWHQESAKPEILYLNKDSVSFTVAESDYNFDCLVHNNAKPINDFIPLVPDLRNTSSKKPFPLIAFQVTYFPNKGICIGITFDHLVADGKSIHNFIKSWASASKLADGNTSFMTESLPCYDRSLVPDPNKIDMAILKEYKVIKESLKFKKDHVAPMDKVLATFVLSLSDIERIEQWVLARVNYDKVISGCPPFHLSKFVLTCAYVWVCFVKSQCVEDGGNDSDEDPIQYFVFSMDCRARLDPPLPNTYFGNCLKACITKTKKSDLIGEDGIAIAAKVIGKAIQKKLDHVDSIWEELKEFLSVVSVVDPFVGGRVLSVAGSTKFGVYETDFGWGKPKKSEVISIANTGAILLSECSSSDIGAVEVSLVRNKNEMEDFANYFNKTVDGFPPRDQ